MAPALAVGTAVAAPVADQPGTKRLAAGVDRYATVAAIVQDSFPTEPVVFVATGEAFADALAGRSGS